ncbi:MAG: hypothetical protein HY549_03650, partial [Elusimicrobia bacterium]|nr:hypothetical protein [Elusimicrobiota bacterium]
MVKCLGIYRERQNSPNRETDDALILQSVIEHLSIQRVETSLIEPEAADRDDLTGWDMIVPMCESYPRLMRLKSLAAQTGALMVNPPDSVLGCYRTRMLESFSRTPGLVYPETELHGVATAGQTPPPWPGTWVKRGDVHNTCDRDVVFVKNAEELQAVRRDFERREISTLLLQKHIDGDLIKFYGVGPGQWFTWFYHDPSTAR